MNINWYPGHMKKTRELLQQQLKLVDIVFELLDARIPLSSKNPDIDAIVGGKPRVIILNKADLANEQATNSWIKYYKSKGITAIPVNTISGDGLRLAINEGENVFKEKMQALIDKGRRARPMRIMVVGIPNVGKSSIINKLVGRKKAITGDRPGVTKGKQWLRVKGDLEILDTPGILWPKFEDQEVAKKLAFTGAIKDEIMDIETLALRLVEYLELNNKQELYQRYNLEGEFQQGIDIMDQIAINRGCILRGKEIDYSRVANIVLDEFRAGKIGRISLETPQNLNLI